MTKPYLQIEAENRKLRIELTKKRALQYSEEVTDRISRLAAKVAENDQRIQRLQKWLPMYRKLSDQVVRYCSISKTRGRAEEEAAFEVLWDLVNELRGEE